MICRSRSLDPILLVVQYPKTTARLIELWHDPTAILLLVSKYLKPVKRVLLLDEGGVEPV